MVQVVRIASRSGGHNAVNRLNAAEIKVFRDQSALGDGCHEARIQKGERRGAHIPFTVVCRHKDLFHRRGGILQIVGIRAIVICAVIDGACPAVGG
ncbi:hypothetical protein SDC9_122367 [bioreactor metagenome]|uniref:Uncharacterized protein n=1 Tax=bioreactor metagenome TaxID=1076179 RepID=A0A645CEP8_9ZZZZ